MGLYRFIHLLAGEATADGVPTADLYVSRSGQYDDSPATWTITDGGLGQVGKWSTPEDALTALNSIAEAVGGLRSAHQYAAIGLSLTVRGLGRADMHRLIEQATEVQPVGLSEIAGKLGVERTTTDMWRQRGVLPEQRWTVGGRPAWDWSELEDWAVRTGRLTL